MSDYTRRNDSLSEPAVFTSEHEDGAPRQPEAEPRYLVGYKVSKHSLDAYQEMAILMHEEGRIPVPRVGALVKYAVEHFAYQFSLETEKRMGEVRLRRMREQGIGDIYDPMREDKSLNPSLEGEL